MKRDKLNHQVPTKQLVRLGRIGGIKLFNALPAIGIALNVAANTRSLSLSILALWVGVRCSLGILKSHNQDNPPKATLPQIIITSLLLLSVRTIAREDDHAGSVVYILFGSSLLASSQLSLQSGKRITEQFSVAALILCGTIIVSTFLTSPDPFSTTWPTGWLTDYNNETLRAPFGRINSLGSTLALLCTICIYSIRLTTNMVLRIAHTVGAFCVFSLCVATQSRTATGTPILAILIAWSLIHGPKLIHQAKGWLKPATIIGIPTLVLITFWITAVQPDISTGLNSELNSSFGRFAQWKCWINNSILAGNNKIIHGQGFDISTFVEKCDNNIAESGLIQILSQHGLLGLIALAILSISYITAINHQDVKKTETQEFTVQIKECSWKEVCIGTSLVIVMSNLTTPVYLGSYWNAALMGIVLGFAFIEPTQKKP